MEKELSATNGLIVGNTPWKWPGRRSASRMPGKKGLWLVVSRFSCLAKVCFVATVARLMESAVNGLKEGCWKHKGG